MKHYFRILIMEAIEKLDWLRNFVHNEEVTSMWCATRDMLKRLICLNNAVIMALWKRLHVYKYDK